MKYKKFYWLNDDSQTFLSRGYLSEGETAESRIREISNKAEWYLKEMTLDEKDKTRFDGFADKFYEYMSRGYYSLASPVWANYGKKRGLPVSCFGSYIDDNMESILYGVAENGMLMKNGGGCSGYFGAVRPRGAPITDQGESSGSVHFMQMYDTLASVVSQGSVRRGFFAAYQDIEHPDADEFLDIGTEGNPIQGLTTSVVVSDEFINGVKAGDAEKRRLWAKVLQRRSEIGYPYIMFSDNVNKNKPQVYIDKNMKIHASQMCSEIALPSTVEETFTCVLSSLNLLHWDEIIETDAIEVLTMFLDTVNEEFVIKSEGQEYLKRARQFAINHRALGAGVLGWHSYLQSKMIAFESKEAAKKNLEIAKTLRERSYNASKELAVMLGEPALLQGYGMRNATTAAIAPTKSCVVPETEFLDGVGDPIDYYTFCDRGGLDLNEIMAIEVEFEDGSVKTFQYNDKIEVDGVEMFVHELLDRQ
jgi:ribonucleoside-diphosphate reductase alpha chain